MMALTGTPKGGRLPLDSFVIGESTPALVGMEGVLAALLLIIF